MSFDTEFDYAVVVTAIGDEKTRIQANLDVNNAELALLQAATDYSSTTASRITSLNEEIARQTAIIAQHDEVLAEIAIIQALDSTTKDTLYYFYTVVTPGKADFMAKMPFNYSTALADPVIVALQADTTTPAESKTAVAKLIYGNTRMSPNHIHSLICIYRAVR